MALYSQMYMTVDGILLFENQDLEVDFPDTDTDVDTVLGGAAGVSPGPDKCMITVNDAVKSAGCTINLGKAKRQRTELQVVVGRIGNANQLKGTFLVRSVNFKSGTAQATVQNATFTSIGKAPEQPDGW